MELKKDRTNLMSISFERPGIGLGLSENGLVAAEAFDAFESFELSGFGSLGPLGLLKIFQRKFRHLQPQVGQSEAEAGLGGFVNVELERDIR